MTSAPLRNAVPEERGAVDDNGGKIAAQMENKKRKMSNVYV